MGLAGFTAESVLYTSKRHYRTYAAADPGEGVTLQQSPLGISRLPGHTFCQSPACDWVTDPDTGQVACGQWCETCLPGIRPGSPACTDFINECDPSACCPPGQNRCYKDGTTQFCCPPGQNCCKEDTHLCCPQGASCCGGACCAAPKVCCGNSYVGKCIDTNTDLNNCGRCGSVCRAPANSTSTCVNGRCDFICDPNLARCGNACVDIGNDPANCGSCGNICQDGICTNGECGLGLLGPIPCGLVRTCPSKFLDPTTCACNCPIANKCGAGCCDPLNQVCCADRCVSFTDASALQYCSAGCPAGYYNCGRVPPHGCCKIGTKCIPGLCQVPGPFN